MIDLIELIQCYITFALFGLIWTIQLVHYPAFHYIDLKKFTEFEKMHMVKITYIVGPLMLGEFVVSLTLLFLTAFALKSIIVFIIVILLWLSTLLFSIPCHKKLANEKNDGEIQKLISTNWARTILWSLKVLIVSFVS